MEQLSIADDATRDVLLTMLRKRNLVPVLGAGFTRNCSTGTGKVPDGAAFTRIMLSAIAAQTGEDTTEISNKKFSEIAQYFMDESFVSREKRNQLIRQNFTGVKLSSAQRSFLSFDWPYVYTLNIDDAIENGSSFSNKVLPYKEIDSAAKDFASVFKVHGDAMWELTYKEPCSLIFSTDSYLQSFSKNSSMLNSIRTDLVEQNTIFLGCSLDDELDLLFSLAQYTGEYSPNRKSIYVTSRKPNRFEENKLARHGINAILLIESYDDFYAQFASLSNGKPDPTSRELINFNVQKVIRPFEGDRRKNIDFLLRSGEGLRHNRKPILPDFYIKRTLSGEITRALERDSITLVRGRRFSGKTMLLSGLAAESISRNLYYFRSDSYVSPIIIRALRDISNGLFIFDTNCLTVETANSLVNLVPDLEKNNSHALVAVNRTEPDVVGILARHVNDENDFELMPRFDDSEVNKINKGLDSLGIRKFANNRTIINNTFELYREYEYTSSEILRDRSLSSSEIDLLFVISLTDKITSNLATAFDVRSTSLFSFVAKMAPLIDIVETSALEIRESHSRYKVILNSQFGLNIFLRKIADREGSAGVSDRLYRIAERLMKNPQFRSIGQNITMFDSVNYLLTEISVAERTAGYRPTVLALYEKLQPLLNESADYWLQRAKASLNLEVNTEALLEGVEFARKAFHEASRDRTADNAEFTIALLYGKLCVETKYKDTKLVLEAIEWFARAIENYGSNSNYVSGPINRRKSRQKKFISRTMRLSHREVVRYCFPFQEKRSYFSARSE